MPITRNFIPQILLNVQDFYFHKVGYTSYDEGIFGQSIEDIGLHHDFLPQYEVRTDGKSLKLAEIAYSINKQRRRVL
jgi:hypothetical protein